MPPPEESLPAPDRSALVTGGAGFIGSALCRNLLARGWRVAALDDGSGRDVPEGGGAAPSDLASHPRFALVRGDVRSIAGLRAMLAGERFDVVVHLAARVGVRRVL